MRSIRRWVGLVLWLWSRVLRLVGRGPRRPVPTDDRAGPIPPAVSAVQSPADAGPAWCLVANVAATRAGRDDAVAAHGASHFEPGALVYVRGVFSGPGRERIEVVGPHRGSARLVAVIVSARWFTQWRASLVDDARVLARLRGREIDGVWGATDAARERAERLALALRSRAR